MGSAVGSLSFAALAGLLLFTNQATRHAVGGACRLCSLSSCVMDHQPKYETETTTFAAVDQARLKAADDERNPIPLSFHQSACVESRPLTRLPASG
jgi:hypothetical protein